MEERIQALLDFAEAEGLELPYDPVFIAWMESKGHVVDLETSEIMFNQADRPVPYVVTPAGLAALQAGEGSE
ncbi:MAG: hypothetical protein DCC55_28480 [Chloroflexi bacterium]|nr:MAG: hypothetical protein DCC55_28480 [Chloroflexota bacterium]